MTPTFDVSIATALASISAEIPPAPMWPQFDAQRRMPLLVIRGENSDLLSAETVAAMAARRDTMDTLTVEGQGHTPLLDDELTIARVADFIEGCRPHGAQL